KRCPTASPRGRETSAQSRGSSTTAWRAGSGRWTTRPRRLPRCWDCSTTSRRERRRREPRASDSTVTTTQGSLHLDLCPSFRGPHPRTRSERAFVMRAYVINLARSLDRRAHITAELQKTGLDYEFITAVDGRELDLDDPTIVDSALIAKNSFPAGTAGCALSHLRTYQKIIADDLDEALILEDDVILPTDLRDLVDAVAGQLTGAEVALLNYGRSSRCKMSVDGSVSLPASRTLALPIDIGGLVNAAAYVITREACERMSKSVLPLRANADDWQFFYREGILD